MKTLLVYDDSVAADVRIKMPGADLKRRGLSVEVRPYKQTTPADFIVYDQTIFQRPIVDLTGPYELIKRAGARFVVEIDDDFSAIPEGHPGWHILGPGNVEGMKKHIWALEHADLITTSTPELARRLSKHNANIVVIPNGYDDTNRLWRGEINRRFNDGKVNLGWAGSSTHKADFALIIRPLIQVLKEHPEARMVLGADVEIYSQLYKIGEHQKLFIPGMKYELYPWIIRHFDVLLAPLEDTYFTQAKSDIKLVEAGAAGIPYVASRVLPYQEWYASGTEGATGHLVDPKNENEWYLALSNLVCSKEARMALGWANARLAENRKISKIHGWQQVAEGAL